MNKFIKVLLAALLLSGCAAANEPGDETPEETVPEKTELKILAPSGAPSIAMLGAFEDGFEITTVDGPDALQAAFANPEPEYDVIVAPTNLGVKLIQAGKAQYRLYDFLVWGNLYLLGTSADVLENPEKLQLQDWSSRRNSRNWLRRHSGIRRLRMPEQLCLPEKRM